MDSDITNLLLGMTVLQTMIGNEYSSQKMEDFSDYSKEETEDKKTSTAKEQKNGQSRRT